MDDSYQLVFIQKKKNYQLPQLSQSHSMNNSLEKSFVEIQDGSDLTLKERSFILNKVSKFSESTKLSHLILLFEQLDKNMLKTKFYSLYIQLIKQLNTFNQQLLNKVSKQQELLVDQKGSSTKTAKKEFSKKMFLLKDYFNAKNIEEDKTNKLKTINNMNMVNSTLGLEVVNLSEKLKQIELDSNIGNLKTTIEELQCANQSQSEQYSQNISEKNTLIQDFKSSNQKLLKTSNRFEKESQDFQLALDITMSKLTQHQIDIKFANHQIAQMREIKQMQFEEILTRAIKNQEDKKLIEKIQDKFKQIKYKIDKMQVDRTIEIDIPEYTEYKEQLINLSQLAQQFNADPIYFAMKPKYDSEDNIVTQDDTKFKDFNFQYQLPFYMVFIEHHHKTFQDEIQIIQYRRIDPQLFIVIRFIMDSYWNTILLNQDNLRKVPRMAEFTYHWIHSFTINPKTRVVQQLSQSESVNQDDKYFRLILDLQTPDLQKVWEIQQFKKLIEDKYTRDEEYFFFYYRFIVFRGQIMNRDNPQCTTQYIPLAYGEMVIEMVLKKYDSQSIMQAKNSLLKYQKIINRKLQDICLVNGWWVMAIIMEFFETEKKHRFSWIQQQFARALGLIKPQKKGIMQKVFPDSATPVITAQLYREAYALNPSLGVTPDSFMVAATESHFLTTQLSVFRSSHFIPISQEDMNKYTSVELQEFQIFFKSLSLKFDFMDDVLKVQIDQLGCTEVIEEINRFKLIINHQLKDFTMINLPFQLHRIFNVLLRVKQLKSFHQVLYNKNDPSIVIIDIIKNLSLTFTDIQYNPILFNNYGDQSFMSIQEIKYYLANIKQISDGFNLFTQNNKASHILRTKSIKKLQKLVRKRIFKFYEEVKKVLYTKIAPLIQRKDAPIISIKSHIKRSVMINPTTQKRISDQFSRKNSVRGSITMKKSQFEKRF